MAANRKTLAAADKHRSVGFRIFIRETRFTGAERNMQQRSCTAFVALANASFTVSLTAAELRTLSGLVHVVDADTLKVGGVAMRLKSVDAMEPGTPEVDAATAKMCNFIHEDDPIICTLIREKTHKREVGFYFRSDGVDHNRAIIAAGVALACPRYDTLYVETETNEARETLRPLLPSTLIETSEEASLTLARNKTCKP
jgi:endonuclease YncB( thermonuclease family)